LGQQSILFAYLGISLAVWAVLGLPLPFGVEFLEAKTPAGFHCADTSRNAHLRKAYDAWMAGFRRTPYITSGEWCTVLPFLWTKNKAENLSYERVWVHHPGDKEHLASDWVFPPGGHDPNRPVIILFTGLAPDKHWTQAGGFVANTAWYLTQTCNMTAVIVVPRGLMDTQVKEHMFHGARAQDVREIVLLAERAMHAARGEAVDAKVPLPLFATGFSMGAMVISSYCGKFGEDTRLAGVVHFSGCYDQIYNRNFKYASKTWQTYLAYGIKVNVYTEHLARITQKRGVNIKKLMSSEVANMDDIDEELVAKVGGYKDGAMGYYRDLGLGFEGKWKNVKVPVLAIFARDDPITHCDSMHAFEFAAGNDNLLFLVTDRGGHVGWPLGWTPWERGFDFMSEGIRVFVEAVLSSARQ